MKKWFSLFVLMAAFTTLALTPQERVLVDNARRYMQAAKEKAIHEQKVQEENERRAVMAEDTVRQQSGQIGELGGQIEQAHKNEQALADWKKANEDTISQVNRYWGLGAFAYGAKVLARHLFWVSIIGGVAALALLIFAPAVFGFLKTLFETVLRVLTSVIRRIGSIFKK
jgi:TolA-binding protein